jgi:hypothetical protein
MMKSSLKYRTAVIGFLLVFSFFHVGYAAVEYICAMGMEMETPECSGCHPDSKTSTREAAFTSGMSPQCCSVVVMKSETIDMYVAHPLDIGAILDHTRSVKPVPIPDSDSPELSVTSITDESFIPLFDLHGVSTSITFSAFLR